MTELEATIRELTRPIEGQLPRPWMTDLAAPDEASVFIVGANQAKTYDASKISHERHINALFNREGESCRGLYNEVTGNAPSPTRQNTDAFRALLNMAGAIKILETNVICYSTPMSNDLRRSEHVAGAKKGHELFTALLRIVKPRVIIVHGTGATKKLASALSANLPEPPSSEAPPLSVEVAGHCIFVIPSLAPPEWNKWSEWRDSHLKQVAHAVAKRL